MSKSNLLRIRAVTEKGACARAQGLEERKGLAKARATMARQSKRNAKIKIITHHVPAAALLYAAAYALPVLDLIEVSNAAGASWALLALVGLVYFRNSLTGSVGPLLFPFATGTAVIALKKGRDCPERNLARARIRCADVYDRQLHRLGSLHPVR